MSAGNREVFPRTCRHCQRHVETDADGRWVDPEATGDDSVWRETCDAHDTFTAEHEPDPGAYVQSFAYQCDELSDRRLGEFALANLTPREVGAAVRLAYLPDSIDPPGPGPFACADCGTATAISYVVTTLDYSNPRETRTELCLDCHDAASVNDGDTTLEQAEAYLRSVGIDPERIRLNERNIR